VSDDPVVRDRRVLLLLGAVVAVVLGLDVASALIPGMDRILAGVPLVVVVLIGGTVLVLGSAVLRRPRR